MTPSDSQVLNMFFCNQYVDVLTECDWYAMDAEILEQIRNATVSMERKKICPSPTTGIALLQLFGITCSFLNMKYKRAKVRV